MKFVAGGITLVAVAAFASAAPPTEKFNKAIEDARKLQEGGIEIEAQFKECMQISGLGNTVTCFEQVETDFLKPLFNATSILFTIMVGADNIDEFDDETCSFYKTHPGIQCFRSEAQVKPFINFLKDIVTSSVNEGCSDGVKNLASLTPKEDTVILDSLAQIEDSSLQFIEDFSEGCEQAFPGITTGALEENSAVLPAASVTALLLAIAQAM